MRDDPGWNREVEHLRLPVELSQQDSGLGADDPRSGSTRIPFIGARSTGMPPSHVHRPGKLWPPLRTARRSALTRESDGRDDVGDSRAAGDERGTAVDRAVPDAALLLIAGVPGADQVAAEGPA